MAKERVRDFGILGKWSEMTMKAQLDIGVYSVSPTVPIIEDLYREYRDSFKERADYLKKQKIKSLTVGQLFDNIKELLGMDEQLASIEGDYRKYQVVITKLAG